MLRAHAVAQAHVMRVARAATVAIILAAGKKRAEHAVLHVKHRHVLVNRDLKPFRRRGGQQRIELHDIQIVACGETFEAEMIFEIARRDAVRHVQRKIADATCVRKKFQVVVVADEIAVGVAGTDLVQNPFLTHLGNARRGDKNRGRWKLGDGSWDGTAARGVNRRDGLAIFFRVFKLTIERVHAAFQRGFQLRRVANEDD